jgi:predicted dehydrogenase
MINAAIVGMGWWGKTLVESVQGSSDVIRFVAGATRTASPELTAFAEGQELKLVGSFEDLLSDPKVDAVVLATPHSLHPRQVVAAAAAGKHVFCEKPFALTKADAEAAAKATQKAGVTLGVGYNRRFHPEMTKLRERIRTGDLGTILHIEATMTFPNALMLKASQWRAQREETPCGGLTPMGVHAIDGMIDLCGPITQVYCQSFRQAVEIDSDDTTSMLFRMKGGMSGYLGTMTATGPGFSFQVFGTKGWVRLEGMTHLAGVSSEEHNYPSGGHLVAQYQTVNQPIALPAIVITMILGRMASYTSDQVMVQRLQTTRSVADGDRNRLHDDRWLSGRDRISALHGCVWRDGGGFHAFTPAQVVGCRKPGSLGARCCFCGHASSSLTALESLSDYTRGIDRGDRAFLWLSVDCRHSCQ